MDLPSRHFQTLYQRIRQHVDLQPNEWEAALPYVEYCHFQKNEFLLAQGQVCRKLYFLLSGYTRVYYQSPFGEVTRDLNKPATFLTALPSYIKETPSEEIIQCMTEVEVLAIPKNHLEELFTKYHNWEHLGRLIIQDMYIDTQQRLYEFIHLTAEERYRKLLKDHSDILDHVPLGVVASFLGVAQPSLSRIRKQLMGE